MTHRSFIREHRIVWVSIIRRLRHLQFQPNPGRHQQNPSGDTRQEDWPDPLVPIEETAEAMQTLLDQGKIRAIGVSNFSVPPIERFRRVAKLEVVQPPYNLFEREIEKDLLPYCRGAGLASRIAPK
jgi:diketogulonate reductase-like aldo/keto reductase